MSTRPFGAWEANVIFKLNQTALVRVAVNTPNQRFEGDFRRVTQFERVILDYLKGTKIGHELQAAKLEPTEDFPYSYLSTNYLEGTSLDYSRAHLQKCAETLAAALRDIYDEAFYNLLIDYRQSPPKPALTEGNLAWMEALLAPLRTEA